MSERPKLGQLIDAIAERARAYEPSVNQSCREAVNRRTCDDANELMAAAANYIARDAAAQHLAAQVVELLHRFWPAEELKLADELARDARAYIEANADNQREELKASYWRYTRARGSQE